MLKFKSGLFSFSLSPVLCLSLYYSFQQFKHVEPDFFLKKPMNIRYFFFMLTEHCGPNLHMSP